MAVYTMENFQKNPLKIYIQDIFRAERSSENKYIYKLFGLHFKNIMLHGVVTAVYNKTTVSTNLELSDTTGSVQIYFDTKKRNQNISIGGMRSMYSDYAEASKFGDENVHIMGFMIDAIAEKNKNCMNFEEGCYLSVVGDIFVDDVKETRMISAYECRTTCVRRDIVWLEELRYLYDAYYLKTDEKNNNI